MTQEKTFIVYMVTNTINGKRYVGATCRGLDVRRAQHIRDAKASRPGCRVFNAAIRKYGEDAFIWNVVNTAASFDEMMEEEIRIIASLKPEYNITKGGRGVVGVQRTLEWLANSSKALKGKKRSPEVIEKMRETGLKYSRIREFQHLGPMASRKKVVCLNTGEIYESASAAARSNNLSKSLIIEVCLRNARRKTAGGLVFRYFGDHFGGIEEAGKFLAERDAGRKERGKACTKPIICNTYNIRFSGALAASQEFGIPRWSITEVCNGSKKSVYGLKFSYVGEVS